jgi:hypothetical protein
MVKQITFDEYVLKHYHKQVKCSNCNDIINRVQKCTECSLRNLYFTEYQNKVFLVRERLNELEALKKTEAVKA